MIGEYLPRQMRLLTQVIDIAKAQNLHTEPETEGGHAHKADGMYSGSESLITLDDALSPDTERMTLVHETLHAIFRMAGVDALMTAESPGMEEHVVTVLAPVVLSWLRENPMVLNYLCEYTEAL